MTDTPPDAALFGQIRDALASHRDLAKWQEPLTELARSHYQGARRVDVAEAESDALEAHVDHLDAITTRLLNENAALRHENRQLRTDGEGADPIALFGLLERQVEGLARSMKRAKIGEGGLFCGGCGANIADDAQGVQELRDRISELEAEGPKCAECKAPLNANDSCSANADHIPF